MLGILLVILIIIIIIGKTIQNIQKQEEISKTAQKLNEIIDFERIKDDYDKTIKKERKKIENKKQEDIKIKR